MLWGMCFICDGGTDEEFDDLIESCIDDPGWFVMGVYDPGGPPGWAYTIGLRESFDHPELVLTGRACFHCAHKALNELGDRVAGGDKFVIGDHVFLPEGGEVRFAKVHENHWQTDLFNAWKAFYRARRVTSPPREALQVVWLDDRGRWQDSPDRRRWREERLDRGPHLPSYKGKGRR